MRKNDADEVASDSTDARWRAVFVENSRSLRGARRTSGLAQAIRPERSESSYFELVWSGGRSRLGLVEVLKTLDHGVIHDFARLLLRPTRALRTQERVSTVGAFVASMQGVDQREASGRLGIPTMDQHEPFVDLKVNSSVAERARRSEHAARRNTMTLIGGAVTGLIATSATMFWLIGANGVLASVKIMAFGAVSGGLFGGYFCVKQARIFWLSRTPILAMLCTCAVFAGLGAFGSIAMSPEVFADVPTERAIMAIGGLSLAVAGGAIFGRRISS